jgi:hypothetical protein
VTVKKPFAIPDAPRELPPGVAAATPLISVAWRALRAERQRTAAEWREIEHEAGKTQEILGRLAEEAWRLGADAGAQPAVEKAARRLQEILAEAGISASAPAGAPYTGELMDLFDNIAQRPEAGLTAPYVAEVVKPAILCRGAVLRMGKAIVAVPARAE